MALRAWLGRSLRALAEDTSRMARMEVAPDPKEMSLVSFQGRKDLDDFAVGSDADLGGLSTAHLAMTSDRTAVFRGAISTEVPEGYRFGRTGYAGFRTKMRPPQLYGQRYWDAGLFTHLGLRVKGDGRRYHVNLQTDGPIQSDLFQHRLYLKEPHVWETVLIPFDNFILTNTGERSHGRVEMLKERIKTVGVSIIDRMPGPFSLELEWIRAFNANAQGGQLPQGVEQALLDAQKEEGA